MEGCLLCLELKANIVDAIVLNSNQWNELNITNVLIKHLWPMNHIEVSSWICSSCWGELNEFHKFYMRIVETHKEFGLLAKTVVEKEIITSNNQENKSGWSKISDFERNPGNESVGIPAEELKDFLNEYDLNDDHLQKDLMIEQKSLVKNEFPKKLLPDNNLLIVQKRKRGRPRKDAYNSNINKALEAHKVKQVYRDSSNNTTKVRQAQCETLAEKDSSSNLKNSKINPDHHLITTSKKRSLAHENDHNSNDVGESLDYNENKSNVIAKCTPKTNHSEKDKFLAENFKITCFLCNIPFETFFNMRKHFDEHHTERGHVKCCNKKFYRRSILVDHIHYHLNPNYFKCNQCGKVMADRRCLELHVEIHEGNQEKNHCCDICGKRFAKLGILKKHRTIHLSEEEKQFACSDCGKNFASNYLLSSHYRSVHLKKYAKICDICGKSIRCKDVFERHMLQHEGKKPPSVNCDVCGLVLTDKKALKRHKDIIHPVGGQHEYTCSICSKTSPNLRAHKRHVQYKHVMGYDYKCTICDKAFKRAPTLKEHMASHTGTILYTCPWCPKTFNSNANMHNHRKKVHPKEWEEASRKRYSGNLPPKYKPPTIIEPTDFMDI